MNMSMTGRKVWHLFAFVIGTVTALTAMKLWGQDETPTVQAVNDAVGSLGVDADNLWTLIAAFLVMWMQAGFAMLECGLTRAKNAVNICMKNILDFSFGTLAFYLVGFALMFGTGNDFVGTTGWMLSEAVPMGKGTADNPETFAAIHWSVVSTDCKFLFQLVFAATAATIVSGAMAERTKFKSYMVYSVIITALIYPISGHWIWGGGWLAGMGFWDFAGSTVVHSVGAWLALAGAVVLGPRLGKYGSDGKVNAIPGHSMPLVLLGTFILWLGWFGFNPGSTMGVNGQGALIAHIAATTNMAAALGVIGAIFTSKCWFGKWDGSMACNGALAGLVAITAPCAWVSIPGAAAIGLIAGVLVVASVVFFDRKLKIDDPVGAISVHGTCGAWGTLAVGLFSTADGNEAPLLGLLYGGGFGQLWYQIIGVVSVFAWCMATGFGLFFGIKTVIGLRVSKEEEQVGLDVTEHGMDAYPGFQSIEPKS